MRKVTTTIALLALVGTSVAIAQRARSSTNPNKHLLPDAPVADQVPSEKTLMDPNGIMVLKGLTLPLAVIGHQPLELLAGVLAAAIGMMQQRVRFCPVARSPSKKHAPSLNSKENGLLQIFSWAFRGHCSAEQ